MGGWNGFLRTDFDGRDEGFEGHDTAVFVRLALGEGVFKEGVEDAADAEGRLDHAGHVFHLLDHFLRLYGWGGRVGGWVEGGRLDYAGRVIGLLDNFFRRWGWGGGWVGGWVEEGEAV